MSRQDVIESVKAELDKRACIGVKKYGERLHTNNGRSADQDAWEELLDLVIYQRQQILERDERIETYRRIEDYLNCEAQGVYPAAVPHEHVGVIFDGKKRAFHEGVRTGMRRAMDHLWRARQ